MDNPAENRVDPLIDLYRALYNHYLGKTATWRSYGYVHNQFKELTTKYTPAQCLALVFQHFEWKGTSGKDEFILYRSKNEGYPINWLLNHAGMYAENLRLEVGGDVWNNDEQLGKQVDSWAKQLRNSKTA